MSYKAFAAITLIAAPIIALVAQNLAPQSPPQGQEPSPAVQPQPTAPLPVVQAPMPAAAQPAPPPAEFGQPLPGAGQPFLTAGNGLPKGGEATAPPAVQQDDDAPVIVRAD